MFCPNCGTAVENDARFCPKCGGTISATAQPQAQPYVQPQVQPQQPALGMGWFKFLIYFGLFAGALSNFYSAYQLLSGDVYEGAASLVYAVIDGLEGLDKIAGIGLAITAILGLVARFRLSGFKKNGPKMLNAVYIAAAAVQLIYVIGANAIMPSLVLSNMDFSSMYVSMAVSIAMVGVNTKYFNNRKHLFVND